MVLPPLTLNRQFINDFIEADAPCCALGLVRSDGTVSGFFAMKPEGAVPANGLAMGFGFGYRMLETNDREPIGQFMFDFYGFERYSVLVNPSNPLAIKAIELMIEEKNILFLILGPDQRAITGRNDLSVGDLDGMRDQLRMMLSKRTPQSSFESCVQAFWRNPDLPDLKPLEWVCRDNPAYLDLEIDTAELTPEG